MSFTKIEQADLTGKGVVGLPDTPGLQTMEMQEKFDEIALDVIVPKFNELSTELDDAELDEKISSDDITNMRLNSDIAIEISQDGGETWRATASSGHRIMDGSGTIYSQRSRMQFSNNVTIRDDEPNNATVIQVQPGDKGDKGDAATITIGNVQSGATPAVTNSGSQTDAIFNFTFPKGDDGDAATIQVGTVTSGSSASVTNRGTSSAAIFDFTLPKGDKGDTGQGINILGEYATLADLEAAHPTGNPGNAYMVGTTNPKDLYIWDVGNVEWSNQGQLQGVKGDQGDAATITVGTVTSGATPSVINSGTTENAIFDFVLEPGPQGEQGNAGTIAVGTVTSGQTASVTNSGTSTAAVFDFVLPKGDQGPQGNPTVVNGKSGNNITLYGTDIMRTNALDAVDLDASLTAVESNFNSANVLVDILNWTSNTTAQSGTTLYKKAIALSHVYSESPDIEIGCANGSILPTIAQQENYDLIQYVTVDASIPALYLYARDIPTKPFYIRMFGVDRSGYTPVSITVDMYGAPGAVITWTNADGTTDSATLDSSGTASATVKVIADGSIIVFTDTTVSKNPDDLTQNYSKEVSLTSSSTEVYIMPDNAVYWYGYESSDLEDCTVANGWSDTAWGLALAAPTHNANDIAYTNTANTVMSVGTKNAHTTSKYHVISSSSVVVQDIGLMGAVQTGKDLSINGVANTGIHQTVANTIQHLSATYTAVSGYIVWRNDASRAGNLYALWYE